MDRRGFLGALTVAAGGIFVPQFGRWFRQGSGLLTPDWQRLRLVRTVGVIEMTDDVMQKIRADQSAFLNYADQELRRAARTINHELTRQHFTPTGILWR